MGGGVGETIFLTPIRKPMPHFQYFSVSPSASINVQQHNESIQQSLRDFIHAF